MKITGIDISSWQPPEEMLRIKTVDAHTAGEPLRVIFEGFPELKGSSILERRRYARENYDHIRRALMWEPRGHADMYGCIITPAVTDTADFGVLFIHNEGFSTMCGHGIIAVTTVMLECGFLAVRPQETVVRIDTPAGMVTAFAKVEDGRVTSVKFHNVPSFVYQLDMEVNVPGIGKVEYDIAFGGAFYAFADAEQAGVEMTPENSQKLIETGMKIKRAVMSCTSFKHPSEEDLGFLYGTIFTGPPLSADADSRNVCIFAEGEVDRSPTGTGVSARMALHYAKGDFKIGESMVIESILGSKFRGSVKDVTRFGEFDAVIPEVEGSAYITGRHEFLIDPHDPFKDGFIMR